jgi:hypothetical protein
MQFSFHIMLYVSCSCSCDIAAILAAMNCARIESADGVQGILGRGDFLDFLGRMLMCNDLWSLEPSECGTFEMFLVSHTELDTCAGI